ncbi:hypothetical protein BCR44DRAFT_69279 [Catenaria anguillulae PL171]|uniref:Uncharacterized protein n=1 Tax=Catenaria anguillulae PL171 TaxID=765915 RepID=A0A1Y2HJG7_9FUNG|nr:hypothetical protein BCR44DRAFT_69279 [Catenaria anguillulae PL171]
MYARSGQAPATSALSRSNPAPPPIKTDRPVHILMDDEEDVHQLALDVEMAMDSLDQLINDGPQYTHDPNGHEHDRGEGADHDHPFGAFAFNPDDDGVQQDGDENGYGYEKGENEYKYQYQDQYRHQIDQERPLYADVGEQADGSQEQLDFDFDQELAQLTNGNDYNNPTQHGSETGHAHLQSLDPGATGIDHDNQSHNPSLSSPPWNPYPSSASTAESKDHISHNNQAPMEHHELDVSHDLYNERATHPEPSSHEPAQRPAATSFLRSSFNVHAQERPYEPSTLGYGNDKSPLFHRSINRRSQSHPPAKSVSPSPSQRPATLSAPQEDEHANHDGQEDVEANLHDLGRELDRADLTSGGFDVMAYFGPDGGANTSTVADHPPTHDRDLYDPDQYQPIDPHLHPAYLRASASRHSASTAHPAATFRYSGYDGSRSTTTKWDPLAAPASLDPTAHLTASLHTADLGSPPTTADYVPRAYHNLQLEQLANDLKAQAQEQVRELTHVESRYQAKVDQLEDRIRSLQSDLDRAYHEHTSLAEIRQTLEEEKRVEVADVQRRAFEMFEERMRKVKEGVEKEKTRWEEDKRREIEQAVAEARSSTVVPMKGVGVEAEVQCVPESESIEVSTQTAPSPTTAAGHAGTSNASAAAAIAAISRHWRQSLSPLLREPPADDPGDDPTVWAGLLRAELDMERDALRRMRDEQQQHEHPASRIVELAAENRRLVKEMEAARKVADESSREQQELQVTVDELRAELERVNEDRNQEHAEIVAKWDEAQVALRNECKEALSQAMAQVGLSFQEVKEREEKARLQVDKLEAELVAVKDRARTAIKKIKSQYLDMLRRMRDEVAASQEQDRIRFEQEFDKRKAKLEQQYRERLKVMESSYHERISAVEERNRQTTAPQPTLPPVIADLDVDLAQGAASRPPSAEAKRKPVLAPSKVRAAGKERAVVAVGGGHPVR